MKRQDIHDIHNRIAKGAVYTAIFLFVAGFLVWGITDRLVFWAGFGGGILACIKFALEGPNPELFERYADDIEN